MERELYVNVISYVNALIVNCQITQNICNEILSIFK